MNDITILFLPGLTGDSKCEYVRATSLTVQKSGFRVVVFNYRGIGGIELKVIISKMSKIVFFIIFFIFSIEMFARGFC
jgi:predicted alpha/beta-fold hydrolase